MKFLLAVNRHEVQNHWSFLYFKNRVFYISTEIWICDEKLIRSQLKLQ